MPKPLRDSGARADARPAFNRPPGARAPQRTDDDLRTPKRSSKEKAKHSPAPTPDKDPRASKQKRKPSSPEKSSPVRDRTKYSSGNSTNSTSQLLSENSLAKLNAHNERAFYDEKREERKKKKKQYKDLKGQEAVQKRKKKKNRNVSGAILEEGRAHRKHDHVHRRGGGYEKEYLYEKQTRPRKSRRKWWILGGIILILLIVIPVGVVLANKNKSGNSGENSSSSSSSSSPASGPSNDCTSTTIPPTAKGTYTDITTWVDTTDFNCTYTDETVGGLFVMGLNSKWDDSTKANGNVPSLNSKWSYGSMPIRGVNLGGWLSLEPFITPSLFNYPASANVVDEYTLSQKLGASAQRIIETHYATFITKQDFQDIANAGLDHVRIPFPYWAVTTYDGDPYLPKVAWRYLLRGIEYARESGLRVNLDLHALPGSQNGWTHSGHVGGIDWIIGADGATNAQRSLDIHDQLSKFFSQDRYKNVVTIYGLVNEPKMLVIPHDSVIDWSTKAVKIVRGNGVQQHIAFHDGFLALTDWKDLFQGVDSNMILDTHQYQIFNVGQLKMKHQDKINLACTGWTNLLTTSQNTATGWGPTMDGEWSQADTDCAQYLNNVGVGSRWAGTLNMQDPTQNVLTETCSAPPCSCDQANADPSQYTDSYKKFLKMFAEAQMHSFEQVYGWFYWTWKTENAVQWSWKLGLQAGILPEKAYSPDFKCDSAIPDFSDLSESY